jgi:glutamyl-tRNA reductase
MGMALTLLVVASPTAAPSRCSSRLASTDGAPSCSGRAAIEHVSEATVVATCNRLESRCRRPIPRATSQLLLTARADVVTLAAHLYVHYDHDAARHALRVAAGLDSMVVGEAQILGQLRDAYGAAAEHEAAGRSLHELMQQALRVGKRVHAETGIDHAGQSVVSAALALVPAGVAHRSALVIGAGSMGGLALATLSRASAGPLLVTNRGADRAQRLPRSTPPVGAAMALR